MMIPRYGCLIVQLLNISHMLKHQLIQHGAQSVSGALAHQWDNVYLQRNPDRMSTWLVEWPMYRANSS